MLPFSPLRCLRQQELQIAIGHWLLHLARVGEDVETTPERMLRDMGFIAVLERAIVIPDPYACSFM
jgi:hypothetical protein